MGKIKCLATLQILVNNAFQSDVIFPVLNLALQCCEAPQTQVREGFIIMTFTLALLLLGDKEWREKGGKNAGGECKRLEGSRGIKAGLQVRHRDGVSAASGLEIQPQQSM